MKQFLLSLLFGFFLCISIIFPSFSQLTDDFSDGDFTNNPTWNGGNSVNASVGFQVNGSNQLQPDLPTGGSGTRTAYLSTPIIVNPTTTNYEWNFDVELTFTSPNPPNNTNKAEIYLLSDRNDLSGSLNGYFIEIQDVVTLQRKVGNTETVIPLSNGTTTPLSNPVSVSVRVIYIADTGSGGSWLVFVNGVLQGEATETISIAPSHFGVLYNYSANSRRESFLFDNVTIAPYIDNTPPTVTGVLGAAPNQIRVSFDEPLNIASLQNTDFNVAGFGNPTQITAEPNQAQNFRLTFAINFTVGTSYTLDVQDFEDRFGNVIVPSSTPFTFNDNAAPLGQTLTVLSPTTLQLDFTEEVTTATAQNTANYNLAGNTALSAVRDNTNFKRVYLTFSNEFDDNTISSLDISNIADPAGNAMPVTQTLTFNYDTDRPDVCFLGCVQALSANQLRVIFDEDIDPVSAQIIGNYEVLDGIGNPTSAVLETSSTVLINFSSSFTPQQVYELRIRNVKDLQNNSMTTRTREFSFDPLSPSVILAILLPNNQIELTFSETVESSSSQDVSNYSLDNGIGNPTSAILLSFDTKRVRLTFGSSLNDISNLTLTVQNVNDLQGNASTPQTFNFNTLAPSISKIDVLSRTQIQVTFSENVETSTSQNTANYTVNNGLGNPIVLAPLSPNIIILTFSNDFIVAENYTLTVQNVQDLNSNAIISSSRTFVYRPRITNVSVVSPTVLEIDFDYPPTIADAQNIGKYGVDNSIFSPLSAQLVNGETTKFRLTFGSVFVPNLDYTLTAGFFNLQNEEIAPVSDHIFRRDTQPPSVLSVLVLDDNETQLTFSEEIEEVTAEALNHYNLSGFGQPIDANQTSPTTVELEFNSDFQPSTTYSLTVNSIQDLLGNTLTNQTVTFSLPTPPAPNSLVITEIMADEDPQVGLPAYEYIEIYNASNATQSLQGTKLYDGEGFSNFATLGSYSLGAGQYLILCGNSAFDSLSQFGNTLAVTSFPSLSNTGETLRLVGADDVEISKITYSSSWYQDEQKDDGGYSLERIDINSDCESPANWIASNDPRGGTPAAQNSVFGTVNDTIPPNLVSVFLGQNGTTDSLEVNFSESLDSLDLVNTSFYSVDNGLSISEIIYKNDRQVVLKFGSALSSSAIYTLIIQNIEDCAGNNITAGIRNISTFGVGRMPNQYELIITEIMADEDPQVGLPKAEYLEIYNATNSPLNLGTVKLSDVTNTIDLPSFLIAPTSYLILCTTSKVDSLRSVAGQNVLGVSGFPSLNNSGEKLVLRDSTNAEIHSVDYKTSWYGDLQKANGGYSLEMIDKTNFCGEESNWKASEDPRGGTPAAENSVSAPNPDNESPVLLEVRIINTTANATEILLTFSEKLDSLSAVNIANYSISGIGIDSISQPTNNEVLLKTSSPLNSSISYTLRVQNLTDCAGNIIQATTRTIGIGRMPTFGELLITEIMADEDPQVGLPDAEYLEIFNTTNDLLNLGTVRLFDATNSVILPEVAISPNSYLTLTTTSKVDSFLVQNIEVLGVPSMVSLNNGGELLQLRNIDGQLLHEVNYSTSWYRDSEKSNGGYALEMIDTENLCGEAQNWRESEDPRGGTPSQENSVAAPNPDNERPTITTVALIGTNRISVTFSEKMDSLSIVNPSNYGLQNATIETINWQENNQIEIEFSPNLEPNQVIILTISNVEDCAGNSLLESESFELGIGATPLEFEVLITEIMSDPDPAVGLPNREYLEIYNNSDKRLDIGKLTLTDATNTISLPSKILQPNEYLTLASTTAATEFRNQGIEVLGVTSFPSLGNEGEPLILINTNNETVFEISYEKDWHEDNEKADGGYSLEMIDVNNPCGEANNWTSSSDPRGGTPSEQNSVFGANPDLQSPQVTNLQVVNNQTLVVVFNEKIDLLSAALVSNYVISPSIQIDSIEIITSKSVRIKLQNALQTATLYELLINGITDCSGNEVSNLRLPFGQGTTPQFGQLLITEIMADPAPVVGLPESEYLELTNTTDQILSINGVTLTDATGTSTLPVFQLLPNERVILCPTSSVTAFSRFGKTIGMSSFRTLDNGGERLILRNNQGELLFEITYDDAWHSDNDKRDGGYSLEMIDVSSFCLERENWTSSVSNLGGTPAQQNSVAGTSGDNIAPKIVRAEAINPTTIRIVFDEKLDSLQAVQSRISIQNSNVTITEKSLDETRKILTLSLSDNLDFRTVYTLEVEAITDCAGNLIAQNTTTEVILPEEAEIGDIILNEILFNPPTNGTDFVELFNNSDKYINLQNFSLANLNTDGTIRTQYAISEEVLILKPYEYVAISTSNEQLLIQYPNGNEEGFVESRLPTFADDDGTVILFDNQDNELDRFTYDEDFHLGLLRDEEGVSLERISADAPTQDENNWASAAESVGFGTPAYQNSQSRGNSTPSTEDCFRAEPQVFSPDSDGFEDFTQIYIDCAEVGDLITIKIYDVQGRKVRDLVQNQSVALENTFIRWDGTADDGRKVRIGHYILLLEKYNLNGDVQYLKMRVVVASRF
ncbi:lamin tail domain-containing protein [Bernardetia sp. ABR2-2B]|uniref:lamin tail domain-containing protein n=1 Tax=Bernardetia sp. ABR2-2B TaxID=3127472 RepID=UPI0030D28707